jgi:hypothetical protein
VGAIGHSPLSDGPFLGHQQSSVFCRDIEHFIDFVTAEVNAIDEVREFPGESHPHD